MVAFRNEPPLSSPTMLRFLIRRLIVAMLVVATVMTLAFILTRLSGDLAISIAGPNATQADIEAVRKAYGLDRPLRHAVLRLGRPCGHRRSRRELLLQAPRLRR